MATTCDHPAFFSSLCVACGMPQSMIQTTLETKFTSKVVGKGNIMEYNSKVIQSKGVENLHELRKMKKLILVLDIDLTLIHSVQIDGATPKDTVQDYGNIHHLPIEEMAGNGLKHLVMKKRPFLDKFLEEAAKLFRIHIYTAGTRRYAEAVVKVLDPKGVIIGNRIVSRTEGAALSRPDALTKSLNNIFFDEASMAVILDDREDVWKGLQNEQLLLVRPYHFFYPGEKSSLSVGAQEGCLAEVNVLPTTGNNITTAGPENKPISGSKGVISPIIGLHGQVGQIRGYASSTTPEFTEGDDQLLRCLDVLHDIHRTYFREMNGDIRALQPHAGKTINQMKKKVLEGCTITFSGLIPVNELHPQNHFLWKLAISLGAQVSSDVTPRTTHLLSIQKDTKKVVECLKHRPHNVWILHPDWLVYCRWSLAKAEETTFMLVPLQPGQSRPDPVMDTSPLEVTDTTTSSSSSSASSSQDPKLRAVSTAVQSSAKKRKLSETESTASMTVTSNVGSSKEGKQSQGK